MRFLSLMVIAGALASTSVSYAGGVSINLGLEYDPISKLEYVNTSQPSVEIVDNVTLEPGIYYMSSSGFRLGANFDIYRKTVERTDTRSTRLSSFGMGVLGDYSFELTESGRTLLVGGMEIGYGQLTDKNEFSSRSKGAMWVAGIGGIRYHFTKRIFMELDYRMKWLQYDFPETPRKSYDYSGSTVRISFGIGILSFNEKGDGA